MAQLKHRKSGVLLTVADDRVALFPAYERVAEPKPAEEKPAPKRRQAKSDDE